MARKNRLAKAFLFGILQLGVAAGIPVKPDEIERLIFRMNQALVTEVRRDTDDGDPPEGGSSSKPTSRRPQPP